eukprot:9981826-Karenia_brevis.AAC.1
MEKEVLTRVPEHRAPNRGKYEGQEEPRESKLQEKHGTGEGCPGEEKETKESNNESRGVKTASRKETASIKAIRSEEMRSFMEEDDAWRSRNSTRRTTMRTTIIYTEAMN